MKKQIIGALMAVFVLGAAPSPARACGFFCKIGNLFDCGKWTSNCNPNTSPSPNYGTTSSALTSSPNSGTTAQQKSLVSPANSSPQTPVTPLVVPTPVQPLATANSNNSTGGGGADSTAMVKSGSSGSPAPSGYGAGPIAKPMGGGDAPTASVSGPNTIDAPVAGHAMVAMNDLTNLDKNKLGNPALAYTEAGAHPALIPSAQLPSADLGHAGVKPSLEMNIYKTVGAIPGVEGAKTFQELQSQLAQTLQNKLAMKDWDGVADAASAMIKADPNNIIAYVRRAEAFNHLGRYAEAERDALEAVRRDPSNEKAWKELAWAQLRQGKFKEALETISRAIGLNPRDAEAYAIRAFIREALGDMKGRLDDIAMAAALDSRFQAAYERAKGGQSIYNPQEEEDVLLGLAKPKHRGGDFPAGTLFGGLFALFALGGAAFYVRRLVKKAPLAAPSAPVVKAEPAAPVAKKITTGDIIGKYQLGRVVGRGGMGQVFEAVDLSLSRPVAIKKMTEQLAKLGPQARGLFLKEARTVAQLHHPAIVEIYEILEEGDDLFMVFELLKGKTAQQLLAESGKLPLAKVVELLKPVGEALDFAHARALVHRDLKPGNIMLTEEGHVKLMDFGIARSVGDGVPVAAVPATQGAGAVGFARTSIVAGTVEYRAPEAEAGIVCKEGDVYSLGVTAYELLTGRLPYSPLASAEDKTAQRFARASALAPGLPAGVDEVLAKALQAAPERRLKTPGELIAGLSAASA